MTPTRPDDICALILAAGLGKRLGEAANEKPKPLLEIGGRTLLHRALASCAEAGIKRALIVVGHKADEIQSLVGSGEKWRLGVAYCFNDRYDETNNIYSVHLSGGSPAR